MDIRRRKGRMNKRAAEALAEVGGEPLRGSGFEDEVSEEGFSEVEASDSKSFR
jgi:hypothetical protein